ncbi:MAG: carbohydrate ABC transporter permease [Lachnospiraceae bacterium]
MSKKKRIFLYVFLIGMALIFAAPMLFALLSSVKTKIEIFSTPFSLPETVMWSNYVEAWKGANMGTYFINSIIQSGASVLLLIVLSTMVSFVLSRFQLKMNKGIMLYFLLGMMVPMHTVLVPISYMIGTFNLSDNIVALVMVYVAFGLPFSVLVITNFMKGVNRSLEEAALVDGANFFQTYFYIMLPMTKPAIATVSIFNFLNAWNNVIFPLIFIKDNNLKPLALGILNFNGERGTEYGPLMAAIVITVALPMLVYMLFQEKVESGLAAGAVKE